MNPLNFPGNTMHRRLRTLTSYVLAACTAAALTVSALAQERSGRPAPGHPAGQGHPGAGAAGRPEQAGPGVLSLLPGDSVTQHSIDLAAGGKLDYTATAGTFSLFDQSG